LVSQVTELSPVDILGGMQDYAANHVYVFPAVDGKQQRFSRSAAASPASSQEAGRVARIPVEEFANPASSLDRGVFFVCSRN
jgi:hypothetical protein